MEREKFTEHVELLEANRNDINKLIEIEKKVFEATDKKYYLPDLTKEQWEEEFENSKVFFINFNKQNVGSLILEDQDEGNTLYISGIVILPEYQGRGIAKRTLQDLIKQNKNKKITLVTHPGNPAKALYESLGFVSVTEKENYYGDGEPRVEMEYRLKIFNRD